MYADLQLLSVTHTSLVLIQRAHIDKEDKSKEEDKGGREKKGGGVGVRRGK